MEINISIKDDHMSEEMITFLNAGKYRTVLDEFKEYLRQEYKYKDLSEEKFEYLEKIRRDFHELLIENEVSI